MADLADPGRVALAAAVDRPRRVRLDCEAAGRRGQVGDGHARSARRSGELRRLRALRAVDLDVERHGGRRLREVLQAHRGVGACDRRRARRLVGSCRHRQRDHRCRRDCRDYDRRAPSELVHCRPPSPVTFYHVAPFACKAACGRGWEELPAYTLREDTNASRVHGRAAEPYEPGGGALAIYDRNSSLLLVVRILSISSSRPFPSSSAFSTRRSFQACWSWFRSNSSSSWRVLDASTSMEG